MSVGLWRLYDNVVPRYASIDATAVRHHERYSRISILSDSFLHGERGDKLTGVWMDINR